jgi:hypothetical protein
MARDGCSPSLIWTTNPTAKTITGAILTTTGNTCNTPIPVTFPATVATNAQSFVPEQIGSGMPPSYLSQSYILILLNRPVDNLGYDVRKSSHIHPRNPNSTLEFSFCPKFCIASRTRGEGIIIIDGTEVDLLTPCNMICMSPSPAELITYINFPYSRVCICSQLFGTL